MILTTKNRKHVNAMAWRFRNPSPLGAGGYFMNFATQIVGKIKVIIKSKDSGDLIFLFPAAGPVKSIKIGNLTAELNAVTEKRCLKNEHNAYKLGYIFGAVPK